MLIGNNIALVIYGIFMAKVCYQPFEQLLVNFLNFNQGNSLYFLIGLLQVLFSSMIVLLVAEFLPKSFFLTYSKQNPKYICYTNSIYI